MDSILQELHLVNNVLHLVNNDWYVNVLEINWFMTLHMLWLNFWLASIRFTPNIYRIYSSITRKILYQKHQRKVRCAL